MIKPGKIQKLKKQQKWKMIQLKRKQYNIYKNGEMGTFDMCPFTKPKSKKICLKYQKI